MPSTALNLVTNAKKASYMFGAVTIYSIIMILTSIASLIIGAVFHGRCVIEPNISIYLIVQGATVFLLHILTLSKVSKSNDNRTRTHNIFCVSHKIDFFSLDENTGLPAKHITVE